MAILLNDNLDIAANKPVDNRYGPYATVALAISGIPSFKRHIGLTVGIGLTNTVDYWFKAGTGDTDLIEKVPTVNVPVTSVAGKTGAVTLVKGDVDLGNVDNTSDANKPVSTATQTALNAKENTITPGTTSQYWRGDKSWQTLDKSSVGLGNVDNTSDASKPISTLTQTALDAKQNTLVSSTNIKTINNESILGAGNITISAGGTQVNADWTETNTGSTAFILNKPTLGTAASQNVGTAVGNVVQLQNVGGIAKLPALDGSQLTNLPVSGGSTNLSYTASATGGTVLSDTGNDATLTLADTTNAGLMSPADKTKLNGVATNANNYTHPNHTGDVTSTGDGATAIGNNVVTNAKLAQIAANTIKGRATTGTGNVEDLTAAQVRTILNVADGATANAAATVTPQPLGTAAVGTATAYARADHVHALPTASDIGAQATLVSGTNIKSINGTSLLGGGDISIGSGGTQVNSDWAATTGVAQILNKPVNATTTVGGLMSSTDKQKLDNLGLELTELSVNNTSQVTLQKNKHYFVLKTVNGDVDFALPTNNLSSSGDAIIVRLNTPGGATGSVIIGTVGGTPPFQPLASLNSQSRSVKLVYFNQAWRIEYFAKEQIDLSEITNSGATTGQVPKWNGTAWAPADDSGGGGSGNTNLSYTASATGGTVVSDTGNDATLSLADTTNAGLMSPADKTKLNGLTGPYADLVNGKVPESQLPSYVDDVIEAATQGTRPNPGETGKIYVTLDDNKCWRWTGTTYIEISPSSGQISAVAGLQEALNGKQTTIFNTATIPVTANNQTFTVPTYYPNNNGADLRRTLTTITFGAAVTSGTTIIRLPQWQTNGTGAWRGDQAFFKFQVPVGVTLLFQWNDGTNWLELSKFNWSGSEYWSAYQATVEVGTYVVWERFSTLYGVRDLFSPRLGSVFLSSGQIGQTLEPNNIYNLTTTNTGFHPFNLAPGKLGDRIIFRHSGPAQLQFAQNSGQQLTSYLGSRLGGAVDNPQIEFLCILSGGALTWEDVTANGVVRSVAGKTGNVTLGVGDLTQSGAATGQVIKWNGTVWVPSADSGVTLPEPKVVLREIDLSIPSQRVYSLDMTTFIQGTQLPLSTVPFVVVQDIPTEQVENLDIFLECVILGKKNKVSQTASYVAPSPWDVTVTGDPAQGETVTVTQNWTHPWPINHRSRTGKHNVRNLSTDQHTLIGMDRPNHFAVNALYDAVPIYKFLNGRFITRDVRYRTFSENGSGEFTMTEPLFTPLTSKQNSLAIGRRYPYSSAFTPLRIACRYIVWDPAKTAFITGPLSKTMKIWYAPFPFNIDHVASSMLGLPVCKLNSSYQQEPSMKVWIE